MSRDALVVGINQYEFLPNLQAPARDAEAIAQCLQTYGEFRVHRLPEIIKERQPLVGHQTPITLRQLETALIHLFKPRGATIPHTALFYFSGHGMQRDAGIQEGYLAVSDSQPDVGFSGLSLFWLRRLLQESPVRQRIIILDCCHSGELLNFLEADPGAKPGTDRLFMAASREYESAYESLESPYSVFTQAILDGLNPGHSDTGIITNHALTTWVNQALKGELQQPLFESSGSEIILTRQQGAAATSRPRPSTAICPYRGLEAFDETHAEYFFGRSELTDQLIETLRAQHFVAVVGASGSGKSSLVQAGLIAELRQGQKFSGSDRWRIRLFTPGEHPTKSLAAVFVESDLSELERAEQLRRAEAFLDDGGIGLAQLVRASLLTPSVTSIGPRPHLLLIIDQFEEVFTLCTGPSAEQERQRFFNCLIEAIQSADEYLSIVIVLRADFFGKCSLYSNLAQQVEQNLVMVTPMTYEQIKSTILGPAQKVGLVCEPNLVYTMLLDVVGAPGELPLLQYALSEQWKCRAIDPETGVASLTLNAYTELGGIRGTLQKRATEIFYSLSPDEQAVAKRIFLALTQLGEGTEDTRRRILKSELVSPGVSLSLIERTLEKLVTAKLVVTNRGNGSWNSGGDRIDVTGAESLHSSGMEFHSGSSFDDLLQTKALSPSSFGEGERLAIATIQTDQETIDVVHEALIRNWPLLRGWLEENREMLRRQRQIERAAQEWDQSGQPLGAEYLLRGSRLIDAEDFLEHFPTDLSMLAQHYVTVSQMESQRTRKESRLLQLAVPSVLLVALIVTLNQYRNAVQTQTEKDYQLQIATSRERAAIAQSILQEPNGDPMAALIISRLAATEGGYTYEAQASLRASLESLRLQVQLPGHLQAVRQILFSPNHAVMATTSTDGTIRLWLLDDKTFYTSSIEASTVLSWSAAPSSNPNSAASQPAILAAAFHPDGDQLAAIAQGAHHVNVWSVDSGRLMQQLEATEALTHLAISPTGDWIAAASLSKVWIWNAQTGHLEAQLQTGAVQHLEFRPDGQSLLTVSSDRQVRIWALENPPFQPLEATLKTMLTHPTSVESAVFSPDQRSIATLGEDGMVRLWGAEDGQFYGLLASPSRGSDEGDRVSEINLATLNLSPTEAVLSSNHLTPSSSEASPPLAQIRFSPNGRYLAAISSDHGMQIWQQDTEGQWQPWSLDRAEFQLDKRSLTTIAFSPDSRFLTTGNHTLVGQERPHAVYVWDLETGEKISSLRGHLKPVMTSEFSASGAYIATADQSGNVWLWASGQGGELPAIQLPQSSMLWAGFWSDSPDREPFPSGQKTMSMVTVGADGLLNRWNLMSDPLPVYASGSLSNHSLGGPQPTRSRSAEILPEKPASSFSIQRIWQALVHFKQGRGSAFTSPPPPPGQGTDANAILPAPQPQEITTSSAIAQTKTEAIASVNQPLAAVAFGSYTRLMATATQTGNIEIYETGSPPRLLHSIQIPQPDGQNARPAGIQFLNFSLDNQMLLGISSDSTLYIWDVQSGQLRHSWQSNASLHYAEFSPSGEWIVTASPEHRAQIWDRATGQAIITLSHQGAVTRARFSPDGQRIVTASLDGTAHIWDTATGEVQVVLSGHRGGILDAEFSPDGRSLVTASLDGTVRLWDAATGTEQARLRPPQLGEHPEPLVKTFFSPDGQYVAAISEQGNVHLWVATWEMLLKLASDRSLRDLTPEECIRYLRLTPQDCP